MLSMYIDDNDDDGDDYDDDNDDDDVESGPQQWWWNGDDRVLAYMLHDHSEKEEKMTIRWQLDAVHLGQILKLVVKGNTNSVQRRVVFRKVSLVADIGYMRYKYFSCFAHVAHL